MCRRLLPGEKRHPGAVEPWPGQIDACDLRIEAVRHLHERPRAVACAGVGTEGTAVGEVLERRQPEGDDAVAGGTLQVDHERDPARVVLERGVVAASHVFPPGHRRPLGDRSRPATEGPRLDLFPAQPFGSFTFG